MWMMVCHMTPASVKPEASGPGVPMAINVLSRWIELMPMMAIASLTLSTEALTWPSHSGTVRVALQIEPRDESFIAADDDHHQQIGDHHHVDQSQYRKHDELLAQRGRALDPDETIP